MTTISLNRSSADRLEVDYGTTIFEELTGQSLTRKGQSVRLFDQTTKSSEAYYPADERGKPYVQNFQEAKRWYPISAYAEAHDLDWKTAMCQLANRYLGESLAQGKRSAKLRQLSTIAITPKPPSSYHEQSLVDSTLGSYDRNNFAIYLRHLFGIPVANELLMQFRVGTWFDNFGVSPYWKFCTVFWQIDEKDQVHAGKIMFYSPGSGKRMKEKGNALIPDRPEWAHRLLSMNDFNLEQCLFGLHQLPKQPIDSPIAIVESEKTAIIATAFEPGFVWLACGGLGNLSVDKCKPLAGRSITLFPDLGGFQRWSNKAEELKRLGHTVRVSTVLEGQGSALDRKAGLDIADYLTAHRCETTGRALSSIDGYPALWDCESLQSEPMIKIKTLTDYFNYD